MLSRLSLRLRVFLIFAALAAVVMALIGAGLWLAERKLAQSGIGFLGESAPGSVDALLIAGAVAGFGGLGAIALVWFLFDKNVARPIETLAGGLLTGAMPDAQEGRYLADLAPAARAAADQQARARDDLAQAVAAHEEALSREKSMLESILGDIGAGAILLDAEGHVIFYNAAAAALLPGLGLDRPLARFIRPGAWEAGAARLKSGAPATDLSLVGADGARFAGRMRPLADQDGGLVLILRPARREPVPPRAPLERLRRHAATLTPMLDSLDGPIPANLASAIASEGRGLRDAMKELDTALAPRPPRQRRVASDELARGLGLPIGQLDQLTLAGDGWQIGGLLALMAARLRDMGRSVDVSIQRSSDEARISLDFAAPAPHVSELDTWLEAAPDPDQPELSGADILAHHGTGIWPEPTPDGARLVLPMPISPIAAEVRPGVTYDFNLARRGTADSRPLDALTCVVFDTETTGLTMQDRIVQIAGVRIAGAKLTGERFDMLVNPGRPIPPASTAIHHVTDEMVANAPDTTTALRGFHHFAEGAVLIAHNAPFDMGLLRAAEGETGQHFANKVMDTVLLSAMIWGQGAVHTLDAICERLDITIPPELRHTAMGDTEATAQAYLRMLPALAAKGITRFEHVRAEARKHRRLLADANLPDADSGATSADSAAPAEA